MNIRIYSEERKETNDYEYEYIRLTIFEYIRMSEYSLHTALVAPNISKAVIKMYFIPIKLAQSI